MRYVFIKERAVVLPGMRMTPGTLVYVARLRRDVALGAILTGVEPFVHVTDPRVEWAKAAGKCPNACSPENAPWHQIPCNCTTMTQARLMLREIDRKERP